ANDREFVARNGLARVTTRFAQVNPRHRACGRAIESGVGQRARSRRAQNVAATASDVKSRVTKPGRADQFRNWQGGLSAASEGSGEFDGQPGEPPPLRESSCPFATRNSRNAGACRETDSRRGRWPAARSEGRRNLSRRLRPRSRLVASGFARRQKLDQPITGARDSDHRYQVAQSALQLSLWLFH